MRKALEERGVNAAILTPDSRGEGTPAVFPERTDADRARNRRVEIYWMLPARPSAR